MNNSGWNALMLVCIVPLLATLILGMSTTIPYLKFIPSACLACLLLFLFIKLINTHTYRGFGEMGLLIFMIFFGASFLVNIIAATLLQLFG